MPTLEEIAEIARVSRSTVSRVVNDKPNVSDKTRKRVLQVINQLNFQPNWAARSLASGRTQVLGLVIPMGISRLFTDPYFPILIQGVTLACNAHEHGVMLWLAEPGFEEQGMIDRILNNRLIDGVIVSSMIIDDHIVQGLTKGELPFILIGRHPTEEYVNYIDVDNVVSARQAVSHLLRQGRHRIATITGPQNMYVGIDRREGYLAALRDRGLVEDPTLIVEGDFTEEGGYEAMNKLLPYQPDAIFAASDSMAVGALRALREFGKSVPQDIAVVGFDDMPFAAHSEPPLTTMRQPIRRLGSMAVEMLIDLIENQDLSPCRVILPTELVIRASCGAGF